MLEGEDLRESQLRVHGCRIAWRSAPPRSRGFRRFAKTWPLVCYHVLLGVVSLHERSRRWCAQVWRAASHRSRHRTAAKAEHYAVTAVGVCIDGTRQYSDSLHWIIDDLCCKNQEFSFSFLFLFLSWAHEFKRFIILSLLLLFSFRNESLLNWNQSNQLQRNQLYSLWQNKTNSSCNSLNLRFLSLKYS